VTLLFDEIAFGLDDHQYRDCILMLDLFQANIKKQKYLKFHPSKEKSAKTHPRDFFQFAARAILSEIHERNYKWTWDHFRTRRDQRIQYVECYMANKLNEATEEQARTLKDLERILSFQDIRFYRSIANVKLRKQKVQIGKKRRVDAISSVTYFLKRNRKSKEES
jgi:vacuolar protein sorting-associated protein 13A/C